MKSSMPVLFFGHDSPMNAIEENRFSSEWKAIGQKFPRPRAILSISAHWFTDKTRIMDSASPSTIHDMYGFPRELYEITYPAPGAPEIAQKAKALIQRDTMMDNGWGLDHGTWSVLRRIYPNADIPVFQISIDYHAPLEEHYRIGKNLHALREQGVLLFGSGNVVHNLNKIEWNMDGGFTWAQEFDDYIRKAVENGNHEKIIRYEQAGPSSSLAFHTIDHFAPLLYVLGAVDTHDDVFVFNDACILGSLSMTSYLIG